MAKVIQIEGTPKPTVAATLAAIAALGLGGAFALSNLWLLALAIPACAKIEQASLRQSRSYTQKHDAT
jgi:hypothetical protein